MENVKGKARKGENLIIGIEKNSIADELGIEKGDILKSINSEEIIDIFDYRFLIKDEYLEVEIEKPNSDIWILEIDKYEEEDLGIVFETGLMDDAKSCTNKCIFCFIDQLPKDMRDTLYFKDDDSRLSFLQGNYVSLTNMKEKDLDRIIYYHLSPINVSVHTTNLELRKQMLKNPNSDNLLKYMDKISSGSIEMNFQIVLCKNINDKDELDKTIEDLSKYIPNGKSLSVVPVGITKYRDKLHKMEEFTKEDAREVIKQVNKWQKKFNELYGTSFVYASDEFYIVGEMDFPDYEYYEDFPQIENGVGMVQSFKHEFMEATQKLRIVKDYEPISLITGMGAKGLMNEISNFLYAKYNMDVYVYPIENDFFGHKITVSGLLTAADIINQLKGKDLGKKLLIPRNALKADEYIFLDNMGIEELESKLNIKVEIVEIYGEELVEAIFS